MLELIKVGKLLISDDIDETNALLDASTRFILNTDSSVDEEMSYQLSEDLLTEQSEAENN